MENSCTGDQKDKQHGDQVPEASFHGNRCIAAIQHHDFPGQIMIALTRLYKCLQRSDYLSMFSENKFFGV